MSSMYCGRMMLEIKLSAVPIQCLTSVKFLVLSTKLTSNAGNRTCK